MGTGFWVRLCLCGGVSEGIVGAYRSACALACFTDAGKTSIDMQDMSRAQLSIANRAVTARDFAKHPSHVAQLPLAAMVVGDIG